VRSRVLRAPVLALLAGMLAAAPPVSAEVQGPAPPGTQEVLYVGNNWDGTADVVDPVGFRRLARLNIVPDRAERTREILASPDRAGFFLGIRQLVGEGNDQLVDDMFSSPDGRFLYVSRPSFADVVAFDLTTRRMVWRVPIEGYRSDHMAISPDGRHLLVSASTARKVHVIDARAGPGSSASSRPATSRTRTTTRPTGSGSTTRASAASTRPPTTRRSTARRATAGSRSSTRGPTGSCAASTWAGSSPRPATRT